MPPFDLVYLRLGYHMIIEWGWNQYVHNGKVERMGTTIIEEQWFGRNWLKGHHSSNTLCALVYAVRPPPAHAARAV